MAGTGGIPDRTMTSTMNECPPALTFDQVQRVGPVRFGSAELVTKVSWGAKVTLIHTLPAGPVPVLLYQIVKKNVSPLRAPAWVGAIPRLRSGDRTRAFPIAYPIAPLRSLTTTSIEYVPFARGGPKVAPNSFHPEPVESRLIAEKFRTRAPDGLVRLTQAPAISGAPNGSETFAQATRASFVDHTVAGP